MAKARVAPTLLICQRCGEECERRSNSQRFCKPCKQTVNQEAHRIRSARYEASRPPRKRDKPIDRERQKRWLEQNAAKRQESVRAYNDRNRDRINAKARERNQTDRRREYMREWDAAQRQRPKVRLDQRMKAALQIALKGRKAGRSWESILGFTLAELVSHLERQFLPGMSWDNIGKWHVDHILPKSQFGYASEVDPEFRAAWALTNLRPLWKKDNLSKGAKRLHLI